MKHGRSKGKSGNEARTASVSAASSTATVALSRPIARPHTPPTLGIRYVQFHGPIEGFGKFATGTQGDSPGTFSSTI